MQTSSIPALMHINPLVGRESKDGSMRMHWYGFGRGNVVALRRLDRDAVVTTGNARWKIQAGAGPAPGSGRAR